MEAHGDHKLKLNICHRNRAVPCSQNAPPLAIVLKYALFLSATTYAVDFYNNNKIFSL